MRSSEETQHHERDLQRHHAGTRTGRTRDGAHQDNSYVDWIQAENVKRIEEFAFDAILAVAIGHWERKGGIINISYKSRTNDTQVVEIDRGRKSGHVNVLLVHRRALRSRRRFHLIG